MTMLPVALCSVLVGTVSKGAEAAAAEIGEGLRLRCEEMLTGLSLSGNSDMEVAAFCRRALPPTMCRAMRSSLGSLPWQPEHVDQSCRAFESQVRTASLGLPKERRMMSYLEFQASLDESAKQKAEFGYTLPRNSDGTVDLDRATKRKLAESQKVSALYNEYFGDGSNEAASQEEMGTGGLWERSGLTAGATAMAHRRAPGKQGVAGLLVSFSTFVLGMVIVVGGMAIMVMRTPLHQDRYARYFDEGRQGVEMSDD